MGLAKKAAPSETWHQDAVRFGGCSEIRKCCAKCWYREPASYEQDRKESISREPLRWQQYANYADVFEAPRLMHEVVAIQLLASILNKNNVRVRLGGLLSSMDLWTVLLSGSGCGRSTLITLARPALERAELGEIQRSTTWGSAPALYQYLSNHPNGLFVWGELSEKLKMLSDIRFQGAKEWFTDRYDSLQIPEAITYRMTGVTQRDTPPIRFSEAPRTNILASSSEDWFFGSLLTEDSTGGFLPRWILVRANNAGRVVPIPRTPDERVVQRLADHLRRVNELDGEADFGLIEGDYDQWYRATQLRFSSQPNRALAQAYFNRHRIQILKLALVFEVSSSVSLRVSRAAWTRAVEFAVQLEETIFSLLSTGMSSAGYRRKQMAEEVQSAGEEGLLLSEFTRTFQHTNKREREAHLNTLVISEVIYAFRRTTSGRPSLYLVHNAFVECYRARQPNDVPVSITYGR